MIGTKYTPELLAALAKTPHLTGMGVPVTPDGRKIASYTRRYTDEGTCNSTSAMRSWPLRQWNVAQTEHGSVSYWAVT